MEDTIGEQRSPDRRVRDRRKHAPRDRAPRPQAGRHLSALRSLRRRQRATGPETRGCIAPIPASCRRGSCSSAAPVRCCSVRRSRGTNELCTIDLTNADQIVGAHVVLPRGSLHLRRTRFVRGGVVYERLSVTNHASGRGPDRAVVSSWPATSPTSSKCAARRAAAAGRRSPVGRAERWRRAHLHRPRRAPGETARSTSTRRRTSVSHGVLRYRAAIPLPAPGAVLDLTLRSCTTPRRGDPTSASTFDAARASRQSARTMMARGTRVAVVAHAVQPVARAIGGGHRHAPRSGLGRALSVRRRALVQHGVRPRRPHHGAAAAVGAARDRARRAPSSRRDAGHAASTMRATRSRARSCTSRATARWRASARCRSAATTAASIPRRCSSCSPRSTIAAPAIARWSRDLWPHSSRLSSWLEDLRRRRRRRAHRVHAALADRPGAAGLEGLARLGSPRRWLDRRRSDRALRGPGLRLRGMDGRRRARRRSSVDAADERAMPPRRRRARRTPSRSASGATSSARTRSRSTATSVPAASARRTRGTVCSPGSPRQDRALRTAETLLDATRSPGGAFEPSRPPRCSSTRCRTTTGRSGRTTRLSSRPGSRAISGPISRSTRAPGALRRDHPSRAAPAAGAVLRLRAASGGRADVVSGGVRAAGLGRGRGVHAAAVGARSRRRRDDEHCSFRAATSARSV